MTIEHRFGPLCHVMIDVYVGFHGRDVESAMATEVSIHGMFIKSDITHCHLEEDIELYIWIDDILYNARGVIVRLSDAGYGVQFKHLSSSTYQALWKITRSEHMYHTMDPVSVDYSLHLEG